jgi:flap endonuclease-1
MGIKDLGSFLKDYDVSKFVNINAFSGKRIAIDANAWIYANFAIARKHVINATNLKTDEPDNDKIIQRGIELLNSFLKRFFENNIIPVFIFDGTSIVEKKETNEKRTKIKEDTKNKIEELKQKLSEIDLLDDSGDIENNLKTKMRALNVIEKEKYVIIREQLEKNGVPILTSLGDAEKLCALLCVEGKVAAVFSPDLDNLVYGCPILIRNIKGITAECILFHKVLMELEMTKASFVDFCIMCECDYNKRIPLIGVKKSYAFIKEHKKIENIDKIKDKIECLNHLRCRELFKVIPSSEFSLTEIDFTPKFMFAKLSNKNRDGNVVLEKLILRKSDSV